VKITHFGFIMIGSGYIPTKHKTIIKSETFRTTIAGVSKREEALSVAKWMIEEGAQVVELCGGFKPADAEEIMTATNNEVPIGVVQFSPAAETLLRKQA